VEGFRGLAETVGLGGLLLIVSLALALALAALLLIGTRRFRRGRLTFT
jgi:hypothetical protein